MAKEELRNLQFETMPKGERIIKEGVMLTMSLFGNKTRFPFKYALTDRGVWTKNKKNLFVKSKESFSPYSDFKCYKRTNYGKNECFLFYNKDERKKTGNRIFFDDTEGAVAVLDMFIPRI